jgi:large repetitive protein
MLSRRNLLPLIALLGACVLPASAAFASLVDDLVTAAGPEVTITQHPSNPSNNASPSFAFTASGPATFECKLDAGAFVACTSPTTYANVADGQHTFTVRGTDPPGNTGPETSYAWTIDTVGPTATITSKPTDPSKDKSAAFAFTASEAGASFACRLDQEALASCTSPKSYSGLADGPHTFGVRAIDALGNTGTAVTYQWRIDTVGPTVTITQKPANPSNDRSPSFAFGAGEPASLACKLDTGAFVACTSPTTYANVADGQHTFTVRGTDPAGNLGPDTSYTWAIDATGPSATITQKPSDPTSNKSATFAFTASESGSTFACRLDAAAFAPCTSPTSYTGLGDGAHTFGVRAIDALGNPGAAATFQWTVDTSPPTTAITQKPSTLSNTGSPTFAFSASESGSTFACRRDGGAFAACSSPTGYTGLTDGPHNFGVRSTDPAGNIGPETSYAWTIDTAAPTATITDKPSSSSSTSSPSFAFTASESGSSFVCRLDGGAFAPCASPSQYNGLGDGPHTFGLKATDAAGNTGPEVSYSWTIETRPPTAAVTSAPTGLSNSSSATFTFSADEPSAFDCKLDDRGYDSCGSPVSYHGLSDGAHVFNVRPRDGVGNIGSPAVYGWTVDTSAPETAMASGPASGGAATSATFAFSANEPSAFECRLDGGAFALCGSPKTYGGLTSGEHRFEARAIDAAGNVDATPALYVWTIKAATPPTKKTTSALLAPRSGARVSKPPLLVWRKAARASYYNVQVYRGRLKIFSAWPTKARLQLRARWSFLGRKRSMEPGVYRWYVWPGYGRPSARNYGSLLGQSTFTVVGKKQLKR